MQLVLSKLGIIFKRQAAQDPATIIPLGQEIAQIPKLFTL
jgi:hypothetical protein